MNELKTIRKIRFTIILEKQQERTCKAHVILVDQNNSIILRTQLNFESQAKFDLSHMGKNELKINGKLRSKNML